MAKKSEAKPAIETQRRRVAKNENPLGGASVSASREPKGGRPQDLGVSVPLRQRPSALLDTRVVYCGDNLEQLAKLPDACRKPMQKEEGRMMKPAHSPILHSSFILLHSPLPASHYVKVMLDQIFGEKTVIA